MRKITKAVLTLGVGGALLASVAGAALADPPSGVTPAHTDIVGAGSDTTQQVLDQLSTDYNGQSPAPANKLYSFDAVGSSSITTKTGCASITRPNGSGAGITALKANAQPSGDTTDYCIDFARSSRGPQAGDGTGIAFVAFAQDAVTWSATSTTAKPTHATTSLTDAQLKAIYSCDASQLGTGKTGPVTWNEVGGTSTDAVVPVIPQSNSGTRAFFLSAIGNPTLGSCVQGTDNSVEENEGTNAIFSGSNSPDIVFPYSVAVYLAQSQNGHGTGTQGNQVLRSGQTTSGTVVAPTVGTAPNLTLNPALATVGLTRYVYNVVRNTGSAPYVPTYLQSIFGAGNDTGYVCTNATAQADITSYGFRSLGSNCGAVTIPTS